MNLRSLLFAASALLFAAVATAQGSCPKKQAKHVKETFTQHGELPCSGGAVSFGGLTITSDGMSCPVFGTHTMAHEIEIDAPGETMVEQTGAASTWIHYFECKQDWFLIVPWGSHCMLSATKAGSPQPRYRTIPCLTITP